MEEQVEHLAAPPLDGATAVLALIERVALDPGADVAKLDRIVAMYERVKAKEVELAFNAAKGRILKKLAGIKLVKNRPAALYEIEKGKSQKGSYRAFKYAPLEEIDKHLRPLLLEEEMDLSYTDEPREHGWILMRGRLKAPAGWPLRRFIYARPARHLGRQVDRTGCGKHQFLPPPLYSLQYLQHRGCRR